MSRTSTLPQRLQPMLATLSDAPFDDRNWVFGTSTTGFSSDYLEMAKAFEAVKGNAVIDGELVALDAGGVSHFQLLQNALRKKAKLQYCAERLA